MIYDIWWISPLYIGSKIYIEKIFSKKYPNNIFDWLQGENRNLHKISWEKKSTLVGGKYREGSGEHRGTVQNLGNLKCRPRIYPGERYQKIRTCLSGEVETPPLPSDCEISRCEMLADGIPDVKYPALPGYPDQLHPNSPGWKKLCCKGDRLRVQGVRTPLPDDTERARLSGSTPSGFPKRTCGALPYPDPLKEKHAVLRKWVNITPGW